MEMDWDEQLMLLQRYKIAVIIVLGEKLTWLLPQTLGGETRFYGNFRLLDVSSWLNYTSSYLVDQRDFAEDPGLLCKRLHNLDLRLYPEYATEMELATWTSLPRIGNRESAENSM